MKSQPRALIRGPRRAHPARAVALAAAPTIPAVEGRAAVLPLRSAGAEGSAAAPGWRLHLELPRFNGL